ncbi:hypothetical protein KC352_g23234, partial [Hortaea werneckii]
MGNNSSQPAHPTQTDAATSEPPTQHGDSHMHSSQQINGPPEIAETPSVDPNSGGEIHVASPRSKVAHPRTKRSVAEMENADEDPVAKPKSKKRARKSSEGQKARGRPRDPSQLTRTQPPAEEGQQSQQPETQQTEANGVSQAPKNKKRKLSKADRHAQELAERFVANGEAHAPSDTVDLPVAPQAEQGKSKRQRKKDSSEPVRDGAANASGENSAEGYVEDNGGKEAQKAPRSKRKMRAARSGAMEEDKQEATDSSSQRPPRKISKRRDATNEATRKPDDEEIRTGSLSPEVPESQPVDGENQNIPASESQQHKDQLQVSPKGKPGPQKRKKRKSTADEGAPLAGEDRPSSEPRTDNVKATKAARKQKADANTGAASKSNIGKAPRRSSQQPIPPKSPSKLDGRDQNRDDAALEDHDEGLSSKRDAQDPPTYGLDASDHVRNWLSSQQEASTDAQASDSGKHSSTVNGRRLTGQSDPAPERSGGEEPQPASIHRAQVSKRQQPHTRPGDSNVSTVNLPAPVVNGPAAGAFDSSEKAAADAVFTYMCRQEGLTPTQMRVKVSNWKSVGDFKTEMQAALPNRNQRAI